MTSRLLYLLGGLSITLQLLVCALIAGLALGFLLATARLSRIAPLRWASGAYIEVIRGIPLLVLILFIFFGMQGIVGHGVKIHEFWAAVLAFGLCYGAFMAEVFRAGIESVDPGQVEAARALGLTSRQTTRVIVLPQAVRNILPALVNE
ncbi:MAG: amino acid ABC transporter permease, partial [Candidatus Poribacteria bacterium]|nr:amino acid ABC transporter permease [Candidatus Poribacteria bacterium]